MAQATQIQIGDFVFNAHEAGNPAHELVILLHGFPESSYMWLPLMDEIAGKGYYCVAPDQRGYSPGARPKAKSHYQMQYLRKDVTDMAAALGKSRYHLVGHDWGAFVGWSVAAHHPDQVISWSALSVPHPGAFARAFRNSREQRYKSRYIKWFMMPILSEFMLRRGNFRSFRQMWRRSSDDERDYNLGIFRGRGALTAALNYYRANFGKGGREKMSHIQVPCVFIWGEHDIAVSREAAENNQEFVDGSYQFVELNAGHWLIQTAFDECREVILNHIFSNSTA